MTKHAPIAGLAAIAVAISVPAASWAQTRPEVVTSARVAVLQDCPITPARATENDLNERRPEAAGAILGSLVVGLVGDVAAAGIDAIAGALEEASREKGFSAQGVGYFSFYKIEREVDKGEAILSSRLKRSSSLCLVIAAGEFGSASEVYLAPYQDQIATALGSLAARTTAGTTLAALGLSSAPNLYVEAELLARPDGFVVRPVLLWYRQALKGAPPKALPAELHVSFGLPASTTDESPIGPTFALARMSMPTLKPGDPIKGPQDLIAYSSLLMPERAKAGSAEDTLSALTTPIAAMKLQEAEIRTRERAERAASATYKHDSTLENQLTLEAAQDDLAAAKALLGQMRPQVEVLNDQAAPDHPMFRGGTNVAARYVIVRSQNDFGMAIAKALKARSADVGKAIEDELKPTPATERWTATDTALVSAMAEVDAAAFALNGAVVSGDAEAKFKAELELRKAKAAANAAAAAASKPLPYPGLT